MIQPTHRGPLTRSEARQANGLTLEESGHSCHRGAATHLGDAFIQSARTHAQQLSVITNEETVTYRELHDAALTCAGRLLQLPDWRLGSRVILRMPNSAGYIAAFYGILLAGGIVVPSPMEQTSSWVEQIASATASRFLIDESGVQRTDTMFSIHISRLPEEDEDEVDPSHLAAIFFTSGSAGHPKGVMLSHRNFLANAESIQASLPLRPDDRALAILPFCHAYGNSVLQSHLLAGATLVIAGSASFPETIIDAMQRHRVTSFSGVPQLHQLVFRSPRMSTQVLPDLRYATVAGGALRPDLLRKFSERLSPAELFVMYGQTEATARLSCLPAHQLASHCGSIGRGIPGVRLQVVSPDGLPVIPGCVGEIRAQGANIMRGYWHDPEGTRTILCDGWLYTGDLATVDEDGYIYPQGRKSQLLKIAGYRLHPAEIEKVIAEEMPSVEAIVVPFDSVDGLTRLAMFLVPVGAGVDPNLTAIRAIFARRLAHYQRPAYLTILKDPPLTASLKIDRQRLSQLATTVAQRRSVRSSGSPSLSE